MFSGLVDSHIITFLIQENTPFSYRIINPFLYLPGSDPRIQ